jgi:hypothetical protein
VEEQDDEDDDRDGDADEPEQYGHGVSPSLSAGLTAMAPLVASDLSSTPPSERVIAPGVPVGSFVGHARANPRSTWPRPLSTQCIDAEVLIRWPQPRPA